MHVHMRDTDTGTVHWNAVYDMNWRSKFDNEVKQVAQPNSPDSLGGGHQTVEIQEFQAENSFLPFWQICVSTNGNGNMRKSR